MDIRKELNIMTLLLPLDINLGLLVIQQSFFYNGTNVIQHRSRGHELR